MFSTAAGTVSQMSDRLRSNRDDPTWWLLGLSSLAIADGSPPCMGIHVHTFPWLASRFRVRHGWDVQWCNLPLPDVSQTMWKCDEGESIDETFLTGALGLEPSTQRWLLPWLAMLGVCFALNWIRKAQLVITTRGRGLWRWGEFEALVLRLLKASMLSAPAVLVFGVRGLSFRMIWKPPASFTWY